MRRGASIRRVLVIDHDPERRARTADILRSGGTDPTDVADAETGLRTLASSEPEVLLVDLEMPGPRDARWLLRRLRDDFMGARPRVVLLARPEAVADRLTDLGVDAVVLSPAPPAALVMAVSAAPPVEDRGRAVERLRELCTMSLLSGDIDHALSNVSKRLSLLYRSSDCIVVGTIGEKQWIASSRIGHGLSAGGAVDPDPAAPIWELCRVALDVGAPLLAANDEGKVASWLAVPIEAPGGQSLGAILLVDDQARLYPAETVDALRALGQRLYVELAWRQVHERIAADRDRLRESSMLDPMLPSAWTRAALDQTLPGEISACQRRGEPLSLAIVDVAGMRHINERHGHVVGDAALRHLAYLVRQTLRSQDLVARYGGDALALALPGAPVQDARRVVERLQGIIASSPYVDGEITVPLAVVAGVSPLLSDDDTGDGALQRAAAAMRAAKRRHEPLLVADEALAGELAELVPSGALEPGVTLGGMYQILHELSRGAMGVVYRAEDLGLGRPVALKTLRPDLARDRNFVERFRVEAATLANLRHENLVQVYAFGEGGEGVYFVMELVEGEPVEDRIELACHEGRFMSFDDCARVISQTAGALDAMHRAGVLHRDVKPSNILIDRVRDRAVLVDVGIAKKRGTATDPAGTPGFTAPESFHGGVENAASDVYGLAATAYMLLCTAPPFGTGSGDEIIARQTAGPPPMPPSSYRLGIPSGVDQLILSALDPDASRRPASACEFARALASALAETPALPPAAPSPMPVLPLRDSQADEPTATPRHRPPSENPTLVNVGKPAAMNAPPPMPPDEDDVATDLPKGPPPIRRGSDRHPVLREPDLPAAGVPHTRGVLFRSAYRVLGARQGALWVGQVSRRNPALGQALQPQSTLLSWHPTSVFEAMLQAIGQSGRDPYAFARELGHVATAATFSRFLGADPAALSPWEVLASADLFWRRYHTWGAVDVHRASDGEALLTIAGGPRNPLVCASTLGILERVATLAGARELAVSEISCEAGGGDVCRFAIRWTPRPA